MPNVAGLEYQDYGRGDPPRWPRYTPIRKKLALASPTSGGRSVGIVRSRTKATELREIRQENAHIFVILI
jgi:hypothetical protein